MYIAVVYESMTGNVKAMAEGVAQGVKDAGLDAKLVPVEEATNALLEGAVGCIMGSYTSYGILAGQLKTFLDKTIAIHGKLEGKVGGAFASSGGVGGGAETTLISILQMLLVHGMIIPGNSNSPHFGVIATGKPDSSVLEECKNLGKRVATLAKQLQK